MAKTKAKGIKANERNLRWAFKDAGIVVGKVQVVSSSGNAGIKAVVVEKSGASLSLCLPFGVLPDEAGPRKRLLTNLMRAARRSQQPSNDKAA